jgi:hypothetical protein
MRSRRAPNINYSQLLIVSHVPHPMHALAGEALPTRVSWFENRSLQG